MADGDRGGKPLGAGRRRKGRRDTSGASLFMERDGAVTDGTRSLPPALQPLDRSGGATEVVHVEAFEPSDVRPWRFHNRAGSGMDDASLDALAASIRRDGQQQLGLARRLPAGDGHKVEVIFGVRRLEACRRAGVPWRAEVREAAFADSQCAALMHGENEWTAGVSYLENALQWRAMLDAGVFESQSALAEELGCHRAWVSRALKTASVLLGEAWIERLVRPVMHEFAGRAADRLAAACADETRRPKAIPRAERLDPGDVAADGLYQRLFAEADRPARREPVFVRWKGRAGSGVVAARIDRDEAGNWSVKVRAHEQSPAQQAELAEQVEAVLAAETETAAGIRLGRRLAATLTPEDARDSDRAWLEGCIWSAARASGLEWDRWRCAAVAEVLRVQPHGWELAVVHAIGGSGSDPSDAGGVA